MSYSKSQQESVQNHQHHGTEDSCSYCKKGFVPSHSPTRATIHYIFRRQTRIGIFYGPTHGNCISKITERLLPGVDRNTRVTVA